MRLSPEQVKGRIILEVTGLDLDDGITFEIKEISSIMDDMEYPGIRFSMNAVMEKMVTPVKIDISTGDVSYEAVLNSAGSLLDSHLFSL